MSETYYEILAIVLGGFCGLYAIIRIYRWRIEELKKFNAELDELERLAVEVHKQQQEQK